MADLDHDAWRDEAGLYALGALAGNEREAFEAHLATCAECTADVRALEGVVTALPYAVPLVDPPAALRARVLAAAGAHRRRPGRRSRRCPRARTSRWTVRSSP